MMGARLAAQVWAYWSHLPDRPHRLLLHMAHIIKDDTKAPTYWGGREAMCQALGLEPQTAASHQTVKVTVRRLVDAGALERTMHGHAGKRSEYRLTLERGNTSNPLRGNGSDPLRGNTTDPHRGNGSVPAGVTPATPLGSTEGGTEEIKEEEKSPSKSLSPSARVTEKQASDSRLKLVRELADQKRGAS